MAQAIIRYHRGQLVKIKAEESVRIGVPKNRHWLILQNESVEERLDVVACYVTSANSEDFKRRPMRSTDGVLSKGTKISPKRTMSKDSYIRCGQIYTLRVDQIESYVGTIPTANMVLVDKMLSHLLHIGAEFEEGTDAPRDEKSP